MRTIGFSPKAARAYLAVQISSLTAVVTSWIATGQWNATETRGLIGGAVLALLAGLGAYSGDPGHVTSD